MRERKRRRGEGEERHMEQKNLKKPSFSKRSLKRAGIDVTENLKYNLRQEYSIFIRREKDEERNLRRQKQTHNRSHTQSTLRADAKKNETKRIHDHERPSTGTAEALGGNGNNRGETD